MKDHTILQDYLTDSSSITEEVSLYKWIIQCCCIVMQNILITITLTISLEFETFKGSSQGDAVSGAFFTLYFADAFYHQSAVLDTIRPNPPFDPDTLFPTEWKYADDADFANEDEDSLEEMLPICKDILAEWDLHVNEDKTELSLLHCRKG